VEVTQDRQEVATMMWWNWDFNLITMWSVMAFSVGGLALLIILALRAEFAPTTPEPTDDELPDPRDVLALRLARGEIDTNEYWDRVNALSEADHA